MMVMEADKLVVIVPAGPADAGAIAGLHVQMFDPAWDEASLSAMLQQPGTIACLAMVSDPPSGVGFALCRVAADEAEILTIGILEAWRRRGIAERLVGELAIRAARQGAERLFLEVATDNAAARALYFKLGFAEVGLRPAYYQRPGNSAVDAAILVKKLVP